MIVDELMADRGEFHNTIVTEIKIQALKRGTYARREGRHSSSLHSHLNRKRPPPVRSNPFAKHRNQVIASPDPPTHLALLLSPVIHPSEFYSNNFPEAPLPGSVMVIGVNVIPQSSEKQQAALFMANQSGTRHKGPPGCPVRDYLLRKHIPLLFGYGDGNYEIALPAEDEQDKITRNETLEAAAKKEKQVWAKKNHDTCHELMYHVGWAAHTLIHTRRIRVGQYRRKKTDLALVESCVRVLDRGDRSAKVVAFYLLDLLAKHQNWDVSNLKEWVVETMGEEQLDQVRKEVEES